MGIAHNASHINVAGACLQCGLPVASGHTLHAHPDAYCCYGCYLLHTITGTKGDEARPTLFLARLGFAAFLAMNAQTFTWALYGEDLPFLFPVEPEARETISYVVFVLSLPVYLLVGIPFVRNAFRELRMLAPGVDTLIAIGTTSAFLYSIYSTFTGSLSIYYDTATMVLVLVTFGRYLEATARLKAKDAIGQIAATLPMIAHLVCDGAERDVAAHAVSAGEHVKILPGEQIPVDGDITEGESTVDESLLTGEGAPISKRTGDKVLGGSVNHDGCLLVKATGVADDMYLSRLRRLFDEIFTHRSPSQDYADRIARFFTPAVILMAIGTSIFWWVHTNPSTAFLTGLSVLLIACPCGLGIGATLAASIAYARAAHHGVIARSLSVLEHVGTVRDVFMDKTGTLTEGKPRLETLVLHPAEPGTEDHVLGLLAGLESRSEHPTAKAIIDYAKARRVPLGRVREFRNEAGVGVSGVVEDSTGRSVEVRISKAPANIEGEGFAFTDTTPYRSVSNIYLDNRFSAVVLVADSVRPSAPEAVSRLESLGASVIVLSGDHEGVTRQVAQQAGVNESRGGLSPMEKVAIVTNARSGRRGVCMVGDGINDGAALAAADIGVTLGSGTDFAKSACSLLIVDGDLRKLPWIIRFGQAIRRTIIWNFLWVFLYNMIGVGLAVAGQIRPVFAALAMVLSSALVIVNSSRLARVKL